MSGVPTWLAYGESGLTVEVPDNATVITPRHVDPAHDPDVLLRDALRFPVDGPPLRDLVQKGQTVAISMCDATRPQPRQQMITAILAELEGITRLDDIVVLVATGTHRANTPEEIDRMLGRELANALEIVNHDARNDSSLRWCGMLGADVPVWLNRRWLDADIRITTGFVEPHFFAGFSGGPKLVAPGLAGLETVLVLHDAGRIGHPRATWGICEGNPVHDDVRAIAVATGVDFAFDVVLNSDQKVIAAFGGELFTMHARARDLVRDLAMVEVAAPFDVVVTSNSGFPLDQNLYQAVKGMSAAATVVKQGGAIIVAAECRDGFPDHGMFRQLLESTSNPQDLHLLFSEDTVTVPDQWQVQIFARILAKAEVTLFNDRLTETELARAHVNATTDVTKSLSDIVVRAGPQARVCVLPEGPQTIPYLSA